MNSAWMSSGDLRFPELPTLDEFLEQNLGAWTRPATQPAIAFADFRRDPESSPAAHALREDRDLLTAAL